MAASIIAIIASGLFFLAVSLILIKLNNLSKEVNRCFESCDNLNNRYFKIQNEINSLILSMDNKGKSEPIYPWIIVHAEDGNTYTCYFSNGRWNLNKKEETEIPDDVYKNIVEKITDLEKEKNRINLDQAKKIIDEYNRQNNKLIQDALFNSIQNSQYCCNSMYDNYWNATRNLFYK